MPISLDDEPTPQVGPETDKYLAEALKYRADVAQPRKDKLITRPPLTDPRFSEHAEMERQASAAGAKTTEPIDLGGDEKPRQPISLDEPQKPQSMASKAFGAVKDALTPRMTAQEALDPKQLQSVLTFGLAGLATAGIPGAIAGAAGAYGMSEVHAREREKFRAMGMNEEDANKSAAISSTVLGLGFPLMERAIPPVGKVVPKNIDTPEPPRVGSVYDPAHPYPLPVPERGTVPMPDIRELAQAHQNLTLGAAKSPQVPMESGMLPQYYKPGIAELPTGSITRPQGPLDLPGKTTGDIPPLTTLPTGSMLRTKPRQVETQSPYELQETQPPLVKQPSTGPLEQGFLRTAEDRVREQAALRELPSVEETAQAQRLYSQAQEMRYSQLETDRMTAEWYLENERRKAMAQWIGYDKAKVPVTERPASMTMEATDVPPVIMDGIKQEVPSGTVRFTADTWRELEMSGPLGKRAAQIARDEIDATAERYSQSHIHKVEDLFTRWFGTPELPKYMNPLTLPSIRKFWNISEDQQRQMVNYLYTKSGEYGQILEPTDPKVKGAADELLALVYKFNEHPGIRQATVFQPGKGKVSVGPNTPFYPHHPVSDMARKGLQGRAFDLAYGQWQQRIPDLTRSDFSRMLREADDQFRKYAGLELGRTFDATKGGTAEPYQVLKDLGYGVDPLKDYYSYFVGAARRGQQILAEPELVQIERAMQDAFAEDQAGLNWMQGMMDRIRGAEVGFPDKYFSDFVTKANNAVNLSLLQLAAPAQWNQLTYLLTKAGFGTTFRGLLSMPGWAQDAIVKESGSLFASYIQSYTPSTDMFGQNLQRMLQATTFTTSEMTLRALAAKTGDLYLQRIVKQWATMPQSPKFRALMDEMHFTDADIARIGKTGITMEDRLRAAQVFANETQGRTGFQGLPAWAADNSALIRAILNLKRFMLSNGVEMRRQVVDAWERGVPVSTIFGRLARASVGATVLGEITNDVVYTLAKWDDAFSEERVPKWMRQSMGPVVGRVVQDWVTGLGSIQASLALSMFNAHADVAASMFVPVAVDAVNDAWTNAWKAFQKGDYDALKKYILRHTIGTTGPVQEKPSGGSGLPNMSPGGM